MNEKLLGFLGNDTLFGRIMNKCGVIIATNLMFVIFSIPIVTVGASMSAMHFVMLKVQKEDEDVNPFKLFWQGFRGNFKQSTLAWLVILGLFLFGTFDVRICEAAGGKLEMLRYPILIMGFVLLIFSIYLFPVIASFENKLSILLQNTFYFVCRSFGKGIVLGIVYYFCYFVTYLDLGKAPLYAFIWFFFGFGALSYFTAVLLYKEFEPYLNNKASKDAEGEN